MKAVKPLARKYNPDHKHLEEVEELPWSWKIEMEEPVKVPEGEGSRMLIKVEGEMAQPGMVEVREVLAFYFKEGCSCQHDCCGHYSGGLHEIMQLNSRWYLVTTKYYRNL
jgi:hypothetical protein